MSVKQTHTDGTDGLDEHRATFDEEFEPGGGDHRGDYLPPRTWSHCTL